MLLSDEDQGQAFLTRFIEQSSHNDQEQRTVVRNQIEEMVKIGEHMQCFSMEDVMDAIRTSKEGAPGPDGITVKNVEDLPTEVIRNLVKA